MHFEPIVHIFDHRYQFYNMNQKLKTHVWEVTNNEKTEKWAC